MVLLKGGIPQTQWLNSSRRQSMYETNRLKLWCIFRLRNPFDCLDLTSISDRLYDLNINNNLRVNETKKSCLYYSNHRLLDTET